MATSLLEYRVVHPPRYRYKTPLLFLHGAWHGAWCWQPAMEGFASRGFSCHAISLRGHGNSTLPRAFNLCGLQDYLSDFTQAVEAISPPPILIGHSLGGYIIQRYLMKHRVPGAFLVCSIPHHGTLRLYRRWMLRHPLRVIRAVLLLDGHHLVHTPSIVREACFREDIPAERLARYAALLGSESLRVGLETGLFHFPRPEDNRSPLKVIAAEHDKIFTLQEQQALANAYHTDLFVIPGAAHDVMLEPAWKHAADYIEQTVADWTGDL